MDKKLHQYLSGFGVKPSLQRLAIMEYLMTHRTHPTADEIFNALSPSMPTLSKTTVYNTLKLFAEQGAVLSLDIDPKNTHFDGDITPHAHFYCKSCGAIHDLSVVEGGRLMQAVPDGLQVTEVQVYYKGLCRKCSQYAYDTI